MTKASTDTSSGPGRGCWLLLLLVAIGAGVVLYGFWQVWSTVSRFEHDYLDQGYTLVEGTTVTITETIRVNTYLYGRESVEITAGADASLAISTHAATISGRVRGDVAFLGGDITISEDAIIEGSLDVAMARNVIIRGRVEGEVTGTWTRHYGPAAAEKEPPPDRPGA